LIRQTPQLTVSDGDVGMKRQDFAGGKPLADFASIATRPVVRRNM